MFLLNWSNEQCYKIPTRNYQTMWLLSSENYIEGDDHFEQSWWTKYLVVQSVSPMITGNFQRKPRVRNNWFKKHTIGLKSFHKQRSQYPHWNAMVIYKGLISTSNPPGFSSGLHAEQRTNEPVMAPTEVVVRWICLKSCNGQGTC